MNINIIHTYRVQITREKVRNAIKIKAIKFLE